MKRILLGAALTGLLAVSAQAQPDGTSQARSQVCLNTQNIDHTQTPDNRTILFYMRGGKIWKNTLLNECMGLTFDGFAYVATPPSQICGNMQTIRVIRTGTVCMLGPFEPYTPPPKDKPAQ